MSCERLTGAAELWSTYRGMVHEGSIGMVQYCFWYHMTEEGYILLNRGSGVAGDCGSTLDKTSHPKVRIDGGDETSPTTPAPTSFSDCWCCDSAKRAAGPAGVHENASRIRNVED